MSGSLLVRIRTGDRAPCVRLRRCPTESRARGRWAALLSCCLLVAVSCLPGSSDSDGGWSVNRYTYDLMMKWYLWYDRIPSVDPEAYGTPAELMDAIRYGEIDHWSYVVDESVWRQYREEGTYVGYGFLHKFDGAGDVRVAMIYQDSPLVPAGVGRGDRLVSVNGVEAAYVFQNDLWDELTGGDVVGAENDLVFETRSAGRLDLTVAKEQIAMNSVLHTQVLQVDGTKVGYLVFKTFVETSILELDQAFTALQDAGVTELVLDLRYNGGGLLTVAEYLAGLVGGVKASGVFASIVHNDKNTDSDVSLYFAGPPAPALALDRLLVITTQDTASASELVINSLEPYMDVLLIGSPTHGKPVGMYVWFYGGKAIAPVCFEVVNSLGVGGYFGGLPVDAARADDLTRDFGDPEEACLQEALYYVRNGAFSAAALPAAEVLPAGLPELRGWRQELGAL